MSRSTVRVVLVGLAVSLLIGAGVANFADESPDGLEAAFIRAECADAEDPDACLEEAAGDPVFDGAPLPDYEITWLSGLLGVGVCFALGAGLVALARAGRGRGSGDREDDAERTSRP